MIDSYPKTSNLQKNYERLVEDLEDTEKKYNMVSEGGQSNMMRNAERNHLSLLAEDQLDEIEAPWGGPQNGDVKCYFCAPYSKDNPDDLAEGDRYILSENDFAAYGLADEVLGKGWNE